MMPSVVKLLFHLRHDLLLQSSIELAASLNERLLSDSNELLSVLALFAWVLMLTEMVESADPTSIRDFYHKSIALGWRIRKGFKGLSTFDSFPLIIVASSGLFG